MVTERGGVGRNAANISQINAPVSTTTATEDTTRWRRVGFLRFMAIVRRVFCNFWLRFALSFVVVRGEVGSGWQTHPDSQGKSASAQLTVDGLYRNAWDGACHKAGGIEWALAVCLKSFSPSGTSSHALRRHCTNVLSPIRQPRVTACRTRALASIQFRGRPTASSGAIW